MAYQIYFLQTASTKKCASVLDSIFKITQILNFYWCGWFSTFD